jgi:hypothetical protein
MLDKNFAPGESRKVGEGEVRQLIEKKILFNPPKHDVVIGIGEILKTVQITETDVYPDYVAITGFLNKSILYKTAKRHEAEQFMGEEEPEEVDENGERGREENREGNREDNKENSNNKSKNLYRGEDNKEKGNKEDNKEKGNKEDNKEKGNKEDNKDNKNKEDNKDNKNKENNKGGNKEEKKGAKCESLAPECVAVDGVVRHITTWIPFTSVVQVNGALPGDNVEILSVEVLDPLQEDVIECDNFIIGITEKDIVKIKVRVVRPNSINSKY